MALQAVEVCAITDLILPDSRGGGGVPGCILTDTPAGAQHPAPVPHASHKK